MVDANISVDGAPWCPDCKRSKQFLEEQRVPYNWVYIDPDEEGRRYVQQSNDGRQVGIKPESQTGVLRSQRDRRGFIETSATLETNIIEGSSLSATCKPAARSR